jgi:CDP-diacylglycerol--serine O-phosphatidyltransferase
MRTPRPPRRETLQKGIIILPSAFTLGNLFFGLYAMVAATRGDLIWAGWCIAFAGTLDMLDGSVARFTRTGSRFGAELDSLVDAISFGVAPGFIVYQIFFVDAQWAWILSFVYTTAVVVRLARFNIEQGPEAKRFFHGLPSPAAGGTLATYYPFSQTQFFETYLSDLPWAQIMGVGMILLGVLLVSHVPYAKVPKIGIRTAKGALNTVFVLSMLFTALAVPRYFFFTVGILYVAWGLIRSVLFGLLDRIPHGDPLLDTEEDHLDDRAEVRALDYADLSPGNAHGAPTLTVNERSLEDEA